MTAPSWERNPQDPEDAGDWERWFAPANEYRGLRWDYREERWVPER